MSRLPATLHALGDVAAADVLVLDSAGPVVDCASGTTAERTVSTLALHALFAAGVCGGAATCRCCSTAKLGWLPLFGMTSDNYDELTTAGKTWDMFRHALLPIVCFTYGSLAYYSRFIRANMQEVIRQDLHPHRDRPRACRRARVLWHHAFRNTLIPLVTLIGLTLPALAERRGDPRADLRLAGHGASCSSNRSASATTPRSWG